MNWIGFWATLAAFGGAATFASLVVSIKASLDGDDTSEAITYLVVSFLTSACCAAFAALVS